MKKLFTSLLLLLAISVLAWPQQGGLGVTGGTGVVRRAAGGGPSFFVEDTFTDVDVTALTAHTPETGGAWLYGSPASNNAFIRSATGTLGFDGGATMVYNDVTTPNDSVVTCTMLYKASYSSRLWCAGRIATGSLDMYGIEFDEIVVQIALREAVAGSFADLATPDTSWTPVDNDVVVMELTMAGTTISGRFNVNGGGWTSLGSVTDASHASGKIGIYSRTGGSSTFGPLMSRITAQ